MAKMSQRRLMAECCFRPEESNLQRLFQSQCGGEQLTKNGFNGRVGKRALVLVLQPLEDSPLAVGNMVMVPLPLTGLLIADFLGQLATATDQLYQLVINLVNLLAQII